MVIYGILIGGMPRIYLNLNVIAIQSHIAEVCTCYIYESYLEIGMEIHLKKIKEAYRVNLPNEE